MLPWTLPLILACATSGRGPCGLSEPLSEETGTTVTADAADAAESGPRIVLRGATLLDPGEAPVQADLLLEDGVIVGVGPALEAGGAEEVDVSGLWIVPAFIDSHVHYAYLPRAAEMAAAGVIAGVDMAAPVEAMAVDLAPERVRWSGPMITARKGYPTQSWGRDGYGLECRDAAEAVAAVEGLAAQGVALIKLPITSGPVLDEEALRAAADAAHARGLPVATHALSEAEAALGARIGADVLAHTPTARLSAETTAAWAGRTVISTLAAFGGSSTAVENLRALRAAGATVLYGTDFGNLRDVGISATEIALLEAAGLSGEEILLAGTRLPAEQWGWADLGRLVPGAEASLLVLAADPRAEPGTMGAPVQVWVRGEAVADR